MRVNEYNPSRYNISSSLFPQGITNFSYFLQPPEHILSSDRLINLKNRKKKLLNEEQERAIIEDIRNGVSNVDLSSNIFSNQILRHIIEESVRSPNLKEIGVRFHNLNAKGRNNLKHLLEYKSDWESLNFYIKSLSRYTLCTLSNGLHNCKSLKSFSIVIEYEKDNSAVNLINKFPKNNLRLLSLNFYFSIKMCHLRAIAEFLKTTGIESFSLKSKGWTDEKADLLVKGIMSASELKSIDLSDNNFSSLSKSKASLIESVRHLSGLKFGQSQFNHQDTLIQQLVSNRNQLNVSNHARMRFKERKIKIDYIKSALASGKVFRCNNGFEKGVAKAHDKASGVLAIISLEKYLIITAYKVYKTEKKLKHQLTTAQRLTPFSIDSRLITRLKQQRSEKITLIKSEID